MAQYRLSQRSIKENDDRIWQKKSKGISVRALQYKGILTAAGPWATARATSDTVVQISGLGELWRPRSGPITARAEFSQIAANEQ